MPTVLKAADWRSPPLDERSKYLRRLVVRALDKGERGHIGSSMSLVELLRVLYDDILRFRPAEPKWRERDRMILSKGHGCIALYVMLADKGFIPLEALDTFCHRDSILGGHPEFDKAPGVEASTGALGHGLSIGVGMALAARMQKRDSRVFVVMGDGEINEGSVWEAALMRRQAQVVQSHRDHRLQQDPVRRADPRHPGSGAAPRQVARLRLRRDRSRRARSLAVARGVPTLADRGEPADGDHLSHGEGQGHSLRGERSQLASQSQIGAGRIAQMYQALE